MNQYERSSPKTLAAILSLIAIVVVGTFLAAEKRVRISNLPAAMNAAKWPLYELTWALGDAHEGLIERYAPRPKHLPESEMNQLLVDFKSAELDRVMHAASVLQKHPQQSVPVLITLLDSQEKVLLTENHAMYDYNFFGRSKSYELQSYHAEKIAARAGWLLEKIGFHDFGFKHAIQFDEKLAATQAYVRAKQRGEPEEVLRQMRIDINSSEKRHANAVQNAKKWWKFQGREFDELSAIVDALNSGDASRVEDVFQSFANDSNYIEGMTEESFRSKILPLWEHHAQIAAEDDPHELKSFAEYLLTIYRENDWTVFQRESFILPY